MVSEQIKRRGVKDRKVLAAMRKVKRHLFVPAKQRRHAYADRPLPIGYRQTISQPYIVAFMTEALKLKGQEKVLEVGTGSGYQAAVLAEVAARVYTIEIIGPLARRAKTLLTTLGYKNIKFKAGDGYGGWPDAAPFDAIMITAAPPKVPRPLLKQLKVGGHLVMPVGDDNQRLIRITRTATGYKKQHLLWVRFVPMTGRAQRD
jgi:protein-L-isoaspartate(D-aspartate) O-methyltransferase